MPKPSTRRPKRAVARSNHPTISPISF